jgi:REP element-mobilizing transposase RayT
MARAPRILVAGGIYHVVARGNERKDVYRDENDRSTWLEVLADTTTRLRAEVVAYCEMRNHYHLVVRTPHANLSQMMRELNGTYAQWFNRRHDRVGHLWQGRYGAVLVQDDKHLLTAVRYVVRNPVRAGLCESPQEWLWSSHRATLGLAPRGFLALERLYAQLGGTTAEARLSYAAVTETDEWVDRLGRHRLVDGDEAFTEEMLARVEADPEYPRAMLSPVPLPLDVVLGGKLDPVTIDRAVAHGYSLRAIAHHVGVHPSTVGRRRRAISR